MSLESRTILELQCSYVQFIYTVYVFMLSIYCLCLYKMQGMESFAYGFRCGALDFVQVC